MMHDTPRDACNTRYAGVSPIRDMLVIRDTPIRNADTRHTDTPEKAIKCRGPIGHMPLYGPWGEYG